MNGLPKRLRPWADFFEEAAKIFHLDPFLLAALCDRESLGGLALHPPGPEGTGDGGWGLGLLQIDRRSHRAFCAAKLADGRFAWQDARRNILHGAAIYASGLKALDGDEILAIAAYNAGVTRVKRVLASMPKPVTRAAILGRMDSITTGGEAGPYVSDVLARRDRFKFPTGGVA